MSSGVMPGIRNESGETVNPKRKRAAEAARRCHRVVDESAYEAFAAGAMSPFAVQVMLKPLRLVHEYLGLPSAPLKWWSEYASTNPSLEFENQYCRFLTTTGSFLSGRSVDFLSSEISDIPLA